MPLDLVSPASNSSSVWKLKSCSINNLLPIGAHILGAVHDERRASQVRAGVSTASSALIQLRVVPSLENQGKIGEMPAMGAKSFSDWRLKFGFLRRNSWVSHDLRHSDRIPLVGCSLHHADGRIPGRLCGVRRASCRLGKSEFQRAFPAHFALRGEFHARSFTTSDPDRAGSTGTPQGPPRCARRKARNLHHGADRRDRRFDRSGSRCGIGDYLKQDI